MARLSQWARPALLVLVFALGACSALDSVRSRNDDRPPLSERDLELVRRELAVHPLPARPVYSLTRQACFFFVQHPADKSMIPVGMLQNNNYVVVRRRDGEWTDVQLTSGQRGSVLSVNLRDLTDLEDRSRLYLQPQPGLQPLSLPQASADGVNVDPSLLGG